MVKVFKKVNDGITSILGAYVKHEDGKEYFILPAELKDLAAGYGNLDWENAVEVPAEPAKEAAPAATKPA